MKGHSQPDPFELFQIGNRIDMEILQDGHPIEDPNKRRVLLSKIMDMPSKQVLRIAMPFHEGRIVPLSVGDQYQMNVFTSKGIFGARYTVIKRMREGNLFLSDMEIQSGVKKIQRREFFRHSCRIPALYRIFPRENMAERLTEDIEEVEWKKGVILDLSGGGIRMVSEFREKDNLILQVRFCMVIEGVEREFVFHGKLLTSYKRTPDAILYEQRVEFEDITDAERELIIRYIFEEERKKIMKEKGMS